MSHLHFLWQFFLFLKLPCLVTLHYPKLQVFKNSPKWTIFGIFNELLSSQKVNESRFAPNVEWDFIMIFNLRAVLCRNFDLSDQTQADAQT